MRPGVVAPHAAEHARAKRVEERLAALEHGPGVAPLVDADPAPDSPVRLWRMTDGRLRWRDAGGAVHQAAEETPGPATSVPALPEMDPAPTTLTGQWSAAWVLSYGPGTEAGRFGDGARVMIGFAPMPELATAVQIVAVQVWLYNILGGAEEVRAGVGWHTHAEQPETYAGSAPLSRVDLPAVGSSGWVRIDRRIGRELAEGTARGLVIDQAATGGQPGRLATDAGRSPRVRITYRAEQGIGDV